MYASCFFVDLHYRSGETFLLGLEGVLPGIVCHGVIISNGFGFDYDNLKGCTFVYFLFRSFKFSSDTISLACKYSKLGAYLDS